MSENLLSPFREGRQPERGPGVLVGENGRQTGRAVL